VLEAQPILLVSRILVKNMPINCVGYIGCNSEITKYLEGAETLKYV
jgi:hypothetical protein